MHLDSNSEDETRDRRLDVALNLLDDSGRRRVPGLLILSACVGLAMAIMVLAGTTVLAPKAVPQVVTAAQSSAAPFTLSSSSIAAGPAGSEGSR